MHTLSWHEIIPAIIWKQALTWIHWHSFSYHLLSIFVSMVLTFHSVAPLLSPIPDLEVLARRSCCFALFQHFITTSALDRNLFFKLGFVTLQIWVLTLPLPVGLSSIANCQKEKKNRTKTRKKTGVCQSAPWSFPDHLKGPSTSLTLEYLLWLLNNFTEFSSLWYRSGEGNGWLHRIFRWEHSTRKWVTEVLLQRIFNSYIRAE